MRFPCRKRGQVAAQLYLLRGTWRGVHFPPSPAAASAAQGLPPQAGEDIKNLSTLLARVRDEAALDVASFVVFEEFVVVGHGHVAQSG